MKILVKPGCIEEGAPIYGYEGLCWDGPRIDYRCDTATACKYYEGWACVLFGPECPDGPYCTAGPW